jgi:hypothetical protein
MPNSEALRRVLPRGLVKVTLTTILGVYIATWIFTSPQLSGLLPSILGLLLIPSAILSVLDVFGRSGREWGPPWVKRLTGIAVWALLVGVVSGLIVLAH